MALISPPLLIHSSNYDPQGRLACLPDAIYSSLSVEIVRTSREVLAGQSWWWYEFLAAMVLPHTGVDIFLAKLGGRFLRRALEWLFPQNNLEVLNIHNLLDYL